MKQQVVFLAVLLAVAPVTTVSKSAPLDAYGQLPSLSNVAISQDGSELAFEQSVGDQQAVIIKSIDDRKTLGAFALGGQKLRQLSWAGPTHLLIVVSSTRTIAGLGGGPRGELFVAQDYNVKTQKFVTLLDGFERGMTALSSPPAVRIVNGHTFAFVSSYLIKGYEPSPTLFRIDLDSGETSIVETGEDNVVNWLIDDQGIAVARALFDNSLRHWHLTLRGHENLKETYGVDASIDLPSAYAFGPDGRTIVVQEIDNGVVTYKQVNLSDASVAALPEWGQDISTTIENSLNGRVIATVASDPRGSERVHFINPSDEAIWRGIEVAFAGEVTTLLDTSSDMNRIVVLVDGLKHGSDYELIDRKTHTALSIGLAYRGIGPADIAQVRYISYPAADGLAIPAYLTLPNGRPAQKLPLVVLPHGGPAARDEPGFDWWAQALASRGYAVLQPEFRGSDGFGYSFLAAGFGQWGRKMQSDLSDGVRFLAAQGIADPARVCIVGASYGGYAALAGATLDRGIYRCAVSYAGVSDPRSQVKFDKDQFNLHDDISIRFWDRYFGAASLDDPVLTSISPLAHASDNSIPVLLIHGKDDTVVPIEQSEQMDAALRAAGKNVSFIQLDGEDHWLSRSDTRLKMLQATVDFLEKNNPPN